MRPNYDFTPEETLRMHDYLRRRLLWIDDNGIRTSRTSARSSANPAGANIVDLQVEHPMFSILFRVNPLPQIPALGSWLGLRVRILRSGLQPSTTYGVFDDHGRLIVPSA